MTLAQQFAALDTLLFSTRQYWQCTAFDYDAIPWPELSSLLWALDDQQVSELDSDQNALYAYFAKAIKGLDELQSLCELPTTQQTRDEFPFWISNGIKGRKFEQLQDFVAAISQQKSQYPVLEWCAGKGHLGRMLAFNGAPSIHSIELQAHLCEQGQHSANQQQLPMQFSQANVLTDDVTEYFKEQQHAVALHACGRLHQTFLQQASDAKTQQISFSPCCYHLFTDNDYQAMSEPAKQSLLALTHRDLKLALQETVTAPSRVDKVRKTEVEWRLGFDALRKSITAEQHYVSVPSVNKAIFSDSFKSFCLWAAEKKSLSLPEDIDYHDFLAIGKQRKRVTERVELVRHVFRRAIEVWLVLDRALYLQQQGYQVTVSTFCEKQLTPRNILIQANY
ncbi:methyltransferase [Pseudoalteromonas sp. MEBiC 03607]|uniref:methyltransferase n=1 Tax=Pseudoalteromonas sp. MEBiC 03607 TaxID=2563601 RepID=UPI000C3F8CAC|nr:methyltransferase [Pseudoalteromonas sp. MEBiC 03607]MBU77490.1 methyltransferase [Pseudoalteromonadaceae bacterium]TGV18651.1 methyltransferase [Pseudoalteromonas sp. MEBiC 03607]|tara:strand:- start:49 stop:1227 length:1179 start_codon:yes stop_codon:yes gene_type:complete